LPKEKSKSWWQSIHPIKATQLAAKHLLEGDPYNLGDKASAIGTNAISTAN